MTKKPDLGDLFEVRMDPSTSRFFQYVADDATQLNSHVVRVFKDLYHASQPPDPRRIASGEVDFYAHVFLGIGVKQKVWRNVGHDQPPAAVDVLFRDTSDYGDPRIRISRNWHVWRINGPFEKVGDLRPHHEGAEVGVVVPPDSLVHRMRAGRYDFVYPEY